MQVEIANPIYDTVFKYMMEDNAVAKLLVSSIIKEEVISLEPKPQEHTNDITTGIDDKASLTVYRLDFAATIKTDEGHKLIIIEMQKASVPTDIKRFRTYLGNQYSDPANSIKLEDGRAEPLQIYSIYFLGDDLKICDTPVISVFPEVRDVATGEIITGKSRFLELLNHYCWVVQISCLKKRRRNELELLLSVFDQTNRTADHHILNVNVNDFPEKYRPLIRRLKMAASNKEVKKQMQDEDEVWSYLKDVERIGISKGLAQGKAQGKAERNRLEAKSNQLEAKSNQLQAERNQLQAERNQLEAKYDQLKKDQEMMVVNMHKAGLPVDTIASFIGLSPEQIIEILKSQNV